MQLLVDKRIFIVEDNLANRAIEQMLLEQHGATTAIERWGTTTLDRLRAFAPVHVIVMDLMLPNGVSGFDIAEQIRSLPEFRWTPVVAVSASDPADALPIARARGFAGFISKPISFEKFAGQIARVASGETIWDEGD